MKLNQSILIPAFFLLFIGVLAFLAMSAPIGDWGNYYYGSHGYVDGNKFLIYDPTSFNSYVQSWNEQDFFLSYTQVPPLSLLVYLPFTFLKAGMGKLIFTLLSFFFCAVSITRLFRKLQLDFRWLLLLPLLLFLPVKSNIDAGQSYFLLIAVLTEGWLARTNGKWILSAFLFAFAIHLKIFPAIVLIWFLAEKDWKLFGATIAAVGILFAASLPFIDWGIWKYYAAEVLPRLAKGEITNTYSTSYQSMQVFLKQIFVPDDLHNKRNAFNLPLLYSIGNLVWAGMVLFTATLFSLNKKYNSFFRFSIWIFAGMLISGYGSTYGWIQLIFLAIAVFSTSEISIGKKTFLLVLIALIANVPVQWFLKLSIPFSFPRLIFVLIFFATVIYFFRPAWNRLALITLIIPLFSLVNSREMESGSRYFLKQERSLLVTEFRVYGDTIIYFTRDGEGLHQYREIFPERIDQVEEEYGYPHFVLWQGVDYRFPGERISNLYVINRKYFLYLSDKNRGVGFNTIRIKELYPDEKKKRVREYLQK